MLIYTCRRRRSFFFSTNFSIGKIPEISFKWSWKAVFPRICCELALTLSLSCASKGAYRRHPTSAPHNDNKSLKYSKILHTLIFPLTLVKKPRQQIKTGSLVAVRWSRHGDINRPTALHALNSNISSAQEWLSFQGKAKNLEKLVQEFLSDAAEFFPLSLHPPLIWLPLSNREEGEECPICNMRSEETWLRSQGGVGVWLERLRRTGNICALMWKAHSPHTCRRCSPLKVIWYVFSTPQFHFHALCCAAEL